MPFMTAVQDAHRQVGRDALLRDPPTFPIIGRAAADRAWSASLPCQRKRVEMCHARSSRYHSVGGAGAHPYRRRRKEGTLSYPSTVDTLSDDRLMALHGF